MKTQTSARSLPGAWELIVDSWRFFTSTWNTTIKTSIFFLYAGLAMFLFALLTRFSAALVPVGTIAWLLIIVAVIWVSIRLMVLVLNLETKRKPQTAAEEGKLAWQLFFPFLWITILTGLIVLGASILFIIPGIYFSIALSMADVILIDKGERGTQALAASRALIKGRWWATFWRYIAGNFVFGVIFMAILSVLTFAVSLITGPEFFAASNSADLLPYGVSQFLQMAVTAVFMPLMFAFHVKVYRALERTR